MNLYYFHVNDGQDNIDRVGKNLPGFLSARTEACHFTSDMLTQLPEHVFSVEGWSLTVTDRRGATVLEIMVSAKVFTNIH